MFQGIQIGCRISAKSSARWHFLAYDLTRVMNTVGIKLLDLGDRGLR
jgi:hypothetical protein